MRGKLVQNSFGADKDFRWRGTDVSRIENLSDAVFGFSITLLVLSVQVPRTGAELLEVMRGTLGFALAFVWLVYAWYNHYKLFRCYGLRDAATISLNGLLLFVVVLFIYPFKFIATFLVNVIFRRSVDVVLENGGVVPMIAWADAGLIMMLYSLGYAAVWLSFWLLHLRAIAKRDVLELNDVELFDTRTSLREDFFNVAFGVVSTSMVLIGGNKFVPRAGLMYFLLGPVMGLHGWLSGRRRSRFQTKA